MAFIAFAKVLQVGTKSGDNMEKSARVAALDYLGTVASRLRKDAVTLSTDLDEVINIVSVTRLLHSV